jgi:FkbM family methyltransferase
MNGTLDALRYFVGEGRGLSSKIKIATVLSVGGVFRAIFNRHPVTAEVGLGEFRVRFRVAQGELTPYWQLKDDVRTGIIPPPSEAGLWTVIDCGANIGLFSLIMGRARRVIAIEPNPDCCKRLRDNLRINGVHGEAINKAVSSEAGRMRMRLDRGNTVLARMDEHGNLEVEATTLDRVIADARVETVDLLKLDVEGHEVEALRGAATSLRAARIRRIYVEYKSAGALMRLDALLDEYGFSRAATGDLNARYALGKTS